MPKQRPSPETLLKRVQAEEHHQMHGKLKIYLGAAPGVGKTYAMLEEALIKRKQGIDVIVGVVESHGRQEIESLLSNLEILPRQNLEYRGQKLTEFDLDAALKRHPSIILIDEMAHTNAPNLRHGKRWQDIKELLDRGIDVYTTLNVQHIDSLNYAVQQILHIEVKETVPDFMLERGDIIELIDLPPEDLLKRLQEGKIYIPEQASLAVEHFFRKGNLSALRELALRITAERVEAQVLSYRQDLGIKHVWPTKEKLLVCVSTKYKSTRLIRTTRRMASRLKAEWLAVYVDTPELRISEEKRNGAIRNLRLAERLGAATTILIGADVGKEIMDFAREHNVTRIIIGKEIRARWRDIFFGSLADKIIRQSGEIDVYLITNEFGEIKTPAPTQAKKIPWSIYGFSILIVTAATLLDYFFSYYLHGSIAMLYLIAVTIVASFGEFGPAFFASILSILAFRFCFIAPYYCFSMKDIPSNLNLLFLFIMTQVISYLTIISRRQIKATHLAEHHTHALYMLSRQLASTRGVDNLLATAVHYIAELSDSEVIALLFENNALSIRAKSGTVAILNEKEQSIAQWVYDLGQIAGLGTDTLPLSDSIYVPLITSRKSIGILKIRPTQPKRLFTPEQMHLIESCINQIALAIEVDRSHNTENSPQTKSLP
ncbi:MAG: kdpD [Gammaproteobacteria bacterium]|jgi:two-component system sensor histidine kinase KdpD|nr:kdpD [Gammaproteobacteria bacterium]